MPVEITDVRIFRIIGSGKIKAYANVTLGGEYAVHGGKVMENEKGLWVSMPKQKSASDGAWRDVFHPVTSDARGSVKFSGAGKRNNIMMRKSFNTIPRPTPLYFHWKPILYVMFLQ